MEIMIEVTGWLGVIFGVLAFAFKDQLTIRLVAILSSTLAVVFYGYSDVMQALVFNILLLLVNLYHVPRLMKTRHEYNVFKRYKRRHKNRN